MAILGLITAVLANSKAAIDKGRRSAEFSAGGLGMTFASIASANLFLAQSVTSLAVSALFAGSAIILLFRFAHWLRPTQEL